MSPTNPLAPCGIALAGVALQAAFVASDLRGAYRRAAVLKALASAAFVALGAWGAATAAGPATATSAAAAAAPVPGAAVVVAGLALGAVGDVLHALRFVPEVKRRAHHLFSAGALSFLLGHLAYLCYLVPRVRVAAGAGAAAGIGASPAAATVAAALAGLALGGAVSLVLSRRVRLRGRRALLGALYLLVLAQFLSFACAGWLLEPGAGAGALACGAVLFLVSDSLLALNTFGGRRTGARRAWSLGTYYAAQILIALSLALPAVA